jgi:hypothetical protein
MVGASGFEPPSSWSRTKYLNPINALSGVAYGTTGVISPLLVARNLHVEPGSSNGGFADSPWKRILLVRLAFTSVLIARFHPYSGVSVPKLCLTFELPPKLSQKLWDSLRLYFNVFASPSRGCGLETSSCWWSTTTSPTG